MEQRQRPVLVAVPGGRIDHTLAIHWEISSEALGDIRDLWPELNKATYKQERERLRTLLRHYFQTSGCAGAGLGIAVLGGHPDGSKRLKVRWAPPGHGKSGGWRLLVKVWCNEFRVRIMRVYSRRNEPADADFAG